MPNNEKQQLVADARAFIEAIDNEQYPEGFASGGGDRHIKFSEMAAFAEQHAADTLKAERERVCEWKGEWESYGAYESQCGREFCFTEDGLKENQFKYCCYCGGKIQEVQPK